jgi:hypothetical protein
MLDLFLYVGPSGFGLDPALLKLPGLQVLPPVRRDEVEQLVMQHSAPGVLILCDGVFESHPAVSHREICIALKAGWQVWGVSSIGAIRAREMLQQGMRGYGELFEMFCQEGDFCDDEVCLLHFPEPPYFPVSEPLANLRYALRQVGPELGITPEAGAQLIDYLRGMWFGDRSQATVRDFMQVNLNINAGKVEAFFAWVAKNRIKTLDLQNLLRERPWEQVASS